MTALTMLTEVIRRGQQDTGTEKDIERFVEDLARHIAEEAFRRNPEGFTIHPFTRRLPDVDADSYIVSLYGHGQRLSPAPQPLEPQICNWVRRNLSLLMRGGCFAGQWFNPDDGCHYMDVSVVVHGLEAAKALGREQKQRAIYDPNTDACITLEGSREVASENPILSESSSSSWEERVAMNRRGGLQEMIERQKNRASRRAKRQNKQFRGRLAVITS